MKVCISTPETRQPTGNFGTAHQWAKIFEQELGHEVVVTDQVIEDADVMVAIHAAKCAPAVKRFRQVNPTGTIVVALAGTDIYPEPSDASLESMQLADRLILLQDRAILKVPEPLRGKATTILQSAATCHYCAPDQRSRKPFDICVIGFLRKIKDPMRAAWASRLLPETSEVRILHAGGILESTYDELAHREMEENSRYRWLGIIDRQEIDRLLSQCQAMVLSSYHEGGARVLSYSVVNHTPVLAAASDCAISLLGEDYPGLYTPGNTRELAKLMDRMESDSDFRTRLIRWTVELAPKFHPEREIAAWKQLL